MDLNLVRVIISGLAALCAWIVLFGVSQGAGCTIRDGSGGAVLRNDCKGIFISVRGNLVYVPVNRDGFDTVKPAGEISAYYADNECATTPLLPSHTRTYKAFAEPVQWTDYWAGNQFIAFASPDAPAVAGSEIQSVLFVYEGQAWCEPEISWYNEYPHQTFAPIEWQHIDFFHSSGPSGAPEGFYIKPFRIQ